ncbi:MAG: hypothetical protein WDN69_26040 [Aliidongia sp.]
MFTAIVNRRSASEATKSSGSSAVCSSLSARRIGGASSSARGVGSMPFGVRTKSWSLSRQRSRFSAWLSAG